MDPVTLEVWDHTDQMGQIEPINHVCLVCLGLVNLVKPGDESLVSQGRESLKDVLLVEMLDNQLKIFNPPRECFISLKEGPEIKQMIRMWKSAGFVKDPGKIIKHVRFSKLLNLVAFLRSESSGGKILYRYGGGLDGLVMRTN
ncbi:hypothetical protein FNV43_RR13041 [Rhamnella rubrinervis]|uniref:Uncharacterized protein n=1 Tax=Rhamnella rubrinervis TaxID=2594499 RepID=A0A8K0MDI0_9ROSA|nr:hypothetical protein FNV43_RR13041 [Rhamnella rubrinervis]